MTAEALNKINVRGLGIDGSLVKRLMHDAVWSWFNENQDDVIFEKRVWFFTLKLRYRDVLRPVIERLVGPEDLVPQ